MKLFICLGLIGLATSAAHSAGQASDPNDPVVSLRALSHCILRQKSLRPKVKSLMEMSLLDRRFAEEASSLAHSTICSGSVVVGIKLSPEALRSALYDTMVRLKYLSELETSKYLLNISSDCMLKRNFSVVTRFMMSKPDSEAERATLPPLLEALPTCVPDGYELRASKGDLRTRILETMKAHDSGQSPTQKPAL